MRVPIIVADNRSNFAFPKDFFTSSSVLPHYLGLYDNKSCQTSDDGSPLNLAQEVPHFSYDDLTTLVEVWHNPPKIKNLNNKKQLERIIIATNYLGLQKENTNLLALLAKKYIVLIKQQELLLLRPQDKERDTLSGDPQTNSYDNEDLMLEEDTIVDKLNTALASVQVSCAELLRTKKQSQSKDNQEHLEDGPFQLLTYESHKKQKISSLNLSNQLITSLDGLQEFFSEVSEEYYKWPENQTKRSSQVHITQKRQEQIKKNRAPWSYYAEISKINLSHNLLTNLNVKQLPDFFRFLSLDFSHNKISTVIFNQKADNNIRSLNLSHNNLTGTFDLEEWLNCFPKLDKINLSYNQFDKLILTPWYLHLNHNLEINLSNNKIQNIIIPENCTLNKYTLDLRNNLLTQEQINQLKMAFYVSQKDLEDIRSFVSNKYYGPAALASLISFTYSFAILSAKFENQSMPDYRPDYRLFHLGLLIAEDKVPYTDIFQKASSLIARPRSFEELAMLEGTTYLIVTLIGAGLIQAILANNKLINYEPVPYLTFILKEIFTFGIYAGGSYYIAVNKYNKEVDKILQRYLIQCQDSPSNQLFIDNILAKQSKDIEKIL